LTKFVLRTSEKLVKPDFCRGLTLIKPIHRFSSGFKTFFAGDISSTNKIDLPPGKVP
jgi:hypothetical protein